MRPRLDHRRAALGDGRDERLGEPGGIGDHLGCRLAADLGVLVVGILRSRCGCPRSSCLTPGRRARRPSARAARPRGSGRAGSSRTSDSAGTFGACDRAIRQLVLHGFATVKTRTFGPAASLIAFPWPVKIGPLARIRSARVMPSLRGRPPTRITQSAPSKASSALSVGLDVGQERERAVVELHQGSVERRQGGGDFQKSERDRLVGAEESSGGDPEDQGIADLAPGSGDGDANRCSHGDRPSFDATTLNGGRYVASRCFGRV